MIDNLRLGAFVHRGTTIDHECEPAARCFSHPAGASSADRAYAIRRRAADAGHCPRAHGAPCGPLSDEPSLGLAPKIVEEIFGIIEQIGRGGTAVLVVEQNAALALDVAQYGFVLELGEIALQGDAETLKKLSYRTSVLSLTSPPRRTRGQAIRNTKSWSGCHMAKPELEFFPTDDIAWVPVADAPPGHYQKILTEDPQRMFVTRMLKVDPGCASTETFVDGLLGGSLYS